MVDMLGLKSQIDDILRTLAASIDDLYKKIGDDDTPIDYAKRLEYIRKTLIRVPMNIRASMDDDMKVYELLQLFSNAINEIAINTNVGIEKLVNVATPEKDGLMSAADKLKLDNSALLRKLVISGSMDLADLFVDSDGNPVIDVATYKTGVGEYKKEHYAMYVGGKYYAYDKLLKMEDRSFRYSHIGTYTEEDAPQELLNAFKDRVASAIEWAKKAKNGGFDYDDRNDVFSIWLTDERDVPINSPFEFHNATPNVPGMMSKYDKATLDTINSIFGADIAARSEEGISFPVEKNKTASAGQLHLKVDEQLKITCALTGKVEVIFGDGDDTETVLVNNGEPCLVPNNLGQSVYKDIKIREVIDGFHPSTDYHDFTVTVFVVAKQSNSPSLDDAELEIPDGSGGGTFPGDQ